MENAIEEKVIDAEEGEVKKNKTLPIVVNERGLIEAKDNAELYRYCMALMSGGSAPKHLSTVPQVMSAILTVRQLGMPDFAIRQVANIHGTQSIFGDLPLALAQKTKELTHFREEWFDKDYQKICFENKNLGAEVVGAVCFIARGKMDPLSFSFTLQDAEKANLYPAGQHSPWTKYTRIMLRYKARSIALKSLFADAISGLAIAEYDLDRLPSHEPRDVTETGAEKAKKIFGGADDEHE